MTKFAIYDNGVFVKEQSFDEKPTGLLGKPWRKFYSVEAVTPEYNAGTQVLVGPTIEEDHTAEIRRRVWTVRDKTVEELDVEKEASIDRVDVLAFKVLFNHENRIRALENKAAITVTQFRNALKAML